MIAVSCQKDEFEKANLPHGSAEYKKAIAHADKLKDNASTLLDDVKANKKKYQSFIDAN